MKSPTQNITSPFLRQNHLAELLLLCSAFAAYPAAVFDLLKAPWYHPTLAEIVTYPLEKIADAIKK